VAAAAAALRVLTKQVTPCDALEVRTCLSAPFLRLLLLLLLLLMSPQRTDDAMRRPPGLSVEVRTCSFNLLHLSLLLSHPWWVFRRKHCAMPLTWMM
jgi:hypothetical protein